MSSASLNDMASALKTTFSRPDLSQNLSPELNRILSAYVAKAKKSEGDSLQDDLLSIYRQYVEPQPDKLPPFMAVLKHLGPALINENHLVEWLQTALVPFVDQPGSSRSAMADAQDFVTDAMVYQDDAPDARERSRISARLCALLIEAYIARTNYRTSDASIQTQDQAAQQLQSMLVAFARKKPRDFYVSIDNFLLNIDTRLQALGLLATFLEQQNAHLHLVIQTAVVEHLLKCLMNDTATIVVSAALRCLIMLLPHIPATVATQLPRLFLIYSRCLCWEKFSASSTKAQRDLVTDDRVRRDSGSESDLEFDDEADPTWQTLRTVADIPETSAPELLHYFTYLYGLYPLNFMSYVRKPRKYLKAIDFPGADDFDLDQTVIRTRTEQFQRVHLLHSNVFTTTADEELSENRWLKAEPSEVIAECHGLYVGEQPTLASPGPPPAAKLPALPNFLSLDSSILPIQPKSVAIISQEPAETAQDSPTLAPTDIEKPSAEQLAAAPTVPDDLSYLQRALMLLRNELTFERYLKQQHVAAIGQLKRNHIKAVTVEAETATLINANRALQKKLNDANSFNERMQKETQARRIHTKHTEEQLTAKIRSLKTELSDQDTLQQRLAQAISDSGQLRQLLVQSEARETSQQEQVETFEARLRDSETMRQEVLELEKEIRVLRNQILGYESTQAEHESIKQELESTKYILQHRDQELERSKNAQQAKVTELELRLEEASQELVTSSSQPLPEITAELQTMLAESRVDLVKAKRAYAQLWEEHQHLLANYHEVTGSSDMLPISGSPIPPRSRIPSHGPEYVSQDGSVSSYSPAGSRQAYYTDRGMEQSELYAPHMGYGRVASPVSSLNQSYPPARPLRPEAYQQRAMNANPMSRTQGAYYNEHALHPSATYGAAPSNFGSEYAPSIAPLVREGSKSAFSFTSDDQGSMQDKEKIKPKSEVRVYGRGGAQNIKMKNKDKAEKSEKSPRTNGIRGLKGLM